MFRKIVSSLFWNTVVGHLVLLCSGGLDIGNLNIYISFTHALLFRVRSLNVFWRLFCGVSMKGCEIVDNWQYCEWLFLLFLSLRLNWYIYGLFLWGHILLSEV